MFPKNHGPHGESFPKFVFPPPQKKNQTPPITGEMSAIGGSCATHNSVKGGAFSSFWAFL